MLIFADQFGEDPKIAVVEISAFFLVTIYTMMGVAGCEKVYFKVGKNSCANRRQMFRHVIVPGVFPVIFTGLRLALGTSLIVIIAIEYVRTRRWVGFPTFYYRDILVIEKMYVGLLVVMLLGAGLTYGLQFIEHWVMLWLKEEGVPQSSR